MEPVEYIIKKPTKIYQRMCYYTRPTWGLQAENIEVIYRQVMERIITFAA